MPNRYVLMSRKNEIATEAHVLRATTVFLIERGASPYQFSIASGKGIDSKSIEANLKELFSKVGYNPSFVSNGPDILAISEEEWWIIECKGSGFGTPQTQRNNFDRALASVVSYYEDSPNELQNEYKNVKVTLGLALPATRQYLNELRRRVRKPLRKRLNLWILLFDIGTQKIIPVQPEHDYMEVNV